MFQKYANPTRFLKIANAFLPYLLVSTVVLIGFGVYYAFAASPPDYQQGQTVRIMYVHVPAAWMAMFTYAFVVIASAVGLIWKHPVAHISALAAAPIGACFTVICLTTGSLWGKPMWGTWWVWDARLTSVLILLFLYLGFIALANAFDDAARGEKASAILALIGGINLPIIKFSVDWWNTLHQPASVTKIGMPSIHSSMLIPLLLMAFGMTTLFFTLLIIRIRAELATRRINALRAVRIHAESSGE
ncbi:MAG: Heme exporter protein C [Alphaproteobacteria bacterium MarineAlpha11_Bin1]|nr:MAG: Heme exporter protein C [Alphaproteobacteria bacterium MarineAlpha11_Bin1]|tara:strand:- start:7911 stop:8648 length:738 start_codon:yes stop_codon:yes gene_type:complete